MFETRELSKIIREKKKKALRPDLDDAGQDSVAPETAWQSKMDADVNTTLDNPDHEPASEAEMGEGESSQSKQALKKVQARINSYFEKLMMRK